MRIEEMDFKPRRLLAVVLCVFVSVVFGAFGTVFVVNIYREVRDPTTTLDLFGWIGGGIMTLALALLLLHLVTLPFRLSFHEAGVSVRSVFGRRFVPWSAVRSATVVYSSKGGVEFALRTGRLRGVNIPVGAYKRPASLVAEVGKRLPVPVNVTAGAAPMIAKDDD